MTITSVCAAVAHSEHPLATRAVGECAGELIDAGFSSPEILLVVADRSFSGTMTEVATAFDALVSPGTSMAFVAGQVVVGGRLLHSGSAMAAMAITGCEGAPLIVPEGVSLADAAAACLADLPHGFAPAGPTHALVVTDTPTSFASPEDLHDPAAQFGDGWLVINVAHPALHVNGAKVTGAGGIILEVEPRSAGVRRESIHPMEPLSRALGWRPDACAVFGALDPSHSVLSGKADPDNGAFVADHAGCSLAVGGHLRGMPKGHGAVHVFGLPL